MKLANARALADTAPATAATRDDVFKHVLRYLGIRRTSWVMTNGRVVHDDLEIGLTPDEIVSRTELKTGMDRESAEWFVAAAQAAFSPFRPITTTATEAAA